MTKTSGFAFHCHHDVLCEWVTDYQGRVDYIKSYKPAQEQELRLKLFKMIPIEQLPEDCVKARQAYDKAWEAYVKIGEDKAWQACAKAWEAHVEAGEAHKSEILKLHAKLCPNCPWDGETIFGFKEG